MSRTDVDDLRVGRPEIEILDPRPDHEIDAEIAANNAAAAERSGAVPGVRVEFGREPAAFGHAPGLDGLRGLAVIAVLLFHAHFGFAVGGFLGVSMFFTLSGFLITSLLLRERARDGGISLRGFWSRRFRRLLPAALATQAFVLVLAAFGVWDGDQLRALRTDVPAALLQVLNWSFIVRGTSYVGNTTAPSPLEHFWSLSIEEQFYLVFPVLVAGALLIGRDRRRLLVGPLVAGVGASAWASWHFAAESVDRSYFGLDTRVGELLVGALGACALLYVVKFRSRWAQVLASIAGIAAAATMVVMISRATVSTAWLYPWGLLLTAVCTVALVVAALQPGPVSAVLSFAPLRWVGTVSYGLYLFHWPVFLWLTPRRTGLGQWPLFGVQMAVTIALALLSYRFIEQPIRRGRALTGRWTIRLTAPIAVASIIAGLLITTADLPARDVSLLDASGARSVAGTASGATGAKDVGAALAGSKGAGAKGRPAPAPPQRMLVVGDELAASLVPDPAAASNARRQVSISAQPGCGATVGGTRMVSGQAPETVNSPECALLPQRWTAAVQGTQPDVVVVVTGAWDVTDRQFWSEDPVRHPGEATFDDFLRAEISTRVEELSALGATVAWATIPHVRRTLPGVAFPPESLPDNDPARIDHYNEIVRSLAATTPHMKVVDLAAWAAARPGGDLNPADRPDGVAFAPAGAAAALDWLGEQVHGLTRSTDPATTAAAAMTDTAVDAAIPPAPAPSPRILPAAGERPRIMIAGDSVAFGYAFGLQGWAGDHGVDVENKGQFNCPVARGGTYRFEQSTAEFPDRCDWAEEFPAWLGQIRPHEVVLSTGVWDVVDRILPGERSWKHLGQPVADAYFLRELVAAIDLLSSQGARVVLLTHHQIDVGANKGFTGLPESDPARMARLNELLAKAQSLRPDVTSVVDLAGWVAAQPGGQLDPGKLKDGLHYYDEYLGHIGNWLGPQLLDQLK